jgi:tetratricopeptide (TPR) repeat protein
LAGREAWDLETALDRFDAALDLAPNASFYASRAEVYRLLGRYEEAAADITSALAQDPQLADAWRQKALVSRAQADWDEALTAIDTLIELESDGSAYVLRAQINAAGFGELLSALNDYRTAIHLDPILDRATLVERWHILAGLGSWKEALLVSYKMAAMGAEEPLRYFYRAWALIKLDRIDRAIEQLFFGIQRYPDYGLAFYYALGAAYSEREAWREAIQALEVALAQSGAQRSGDAPEYPPGITTANILGYLGLAYSDLGQCETGAAIVERAITESPLTQDWAWARRRVEACYISLTPTPTPEATPAP